MDRHVGGQPGKVDIDGRFELIGQAPRGPGLWAVGAYIDHGGAEVFESPLCRLHERGRFFVEFAVIVQRDP